MDLAVPGAYRLVAVYLVCRSILAERQGTLTDARFALFYFSLAIVYGTLYVRYPPGRGRTASSGH